ncbi:MAG: FecR family protein [Paludibacteraceae bacterium]
MISEEQIFENLAVDYLSGTISDEDEIVFLEMLRSDENNQIKLRDIAAIRAISFVPSLQAKQQANFKKIENKIWPPPKQGDNRTLFLQILKISALVALAVTVGVSTYFLLSKFGTTQDTVLVSHTIVPNGSTTKLILPDSSVVWLNSGSELKYDNTFGVEERKVTLDGEGYFEVAKDKDKPFIVTTHSIKIRVLGTIFNVDSYADKSTEKVELIEGEVNVSTLDGEQSQQKRLTAHEMIVYNKKSKKIVKSNSSLSVLSQWRLGKLTFSNESLENILIDLEKKFDVHFVIETDKIKSEYFTGSIDLSMKLNDILDYVDVDKKMDITYKGKDVYITNRKRREGNK